MKKKIRKLKKQKMKNIYSESESESDTSRSSDNSRDDNIQRGHRNLNSTDDDSDANEDAPVRIITEAQVQDVPTTQSDSLSVVNLLGVDPSSDTVMGEPINGDIVTRWTVYLSKGIDKEIRDSLSNKWKLPENCPLLSAPKLNNELQGLCSGIQLKKDAFLSAVQDKMGKGLGAIGQVLDCLLTGDNHKDIKEKIIATLVDSAKLLCESHFLISRHRKHEIFPMMNEQVKKIAEESLSDQFLFGSGFAEKCKTAQAAQNACKEYKKPVQPSTSLNFKRPFQKHRINNYQKVDYRIQNEGSRYQRKMITRRMQEKRRK
ncbi:uncharacterized protein [Leptinotarsa decemlineata]|uniref:uncharacterized protein n=1 Tax=Leptinotarsa decemlineata TaxID=7539 RepID=UPI003D30B2E2